MIQARPPPFDTHDYAELMERFIDLLTALGHIEKDFRATKLGLETMCDILFDAHEDNTGEHIQAALSRLRDNW